MQQATESRLLELCAVAASAMAVAAALTRALGQRREQTRISKCRPGEERGRLLWPVRFTDLGVMVPGETEEPWGPSPAAVPGVR